MNCPTCGAKMQGFGCLYNGCEVEQCPRCGSVTTDSMVEGEVSVPLLVERCRQFEESLTPLLRPLWESLGIGEAIHTPDRRPQ